MSAHQYVVRHNVSTPMYRYCQCQYVHQNVGNNGKHHPRRQLTIVAEVGGKTANPELAYRATPENAKRHNVLPSVSRDARMPTDISLLYNVSTPICHYCTMSVHQYVITVQCQYTNMSLLCNVSTPICHYCTMSVHQMFRSVQCQYTNMSLLCNVSTPICHYCAMSVHQYVITVQCQYTNVLLLSMLVHQYIVTVQR